MEDRSTTHDQVMNIIFRAANAGQYADLKHLNKIADEIITLLDGQYRSGYEDGYEDGQEDGL